MEEEAYLGQAWGDAQGMVYLKGRRNKPQGVYYRRRGDDEKIADSWTDIFTLYRLTIEAWCHRVFARENLTLPLLENQLRRRTWRDAPGAKICQGATNYNDAIRAAGHLRPIRAAPRLEICSAMLGERGMRDTMFPGQRYLFQPARLQKNMIVTYDDLSLISRRGATVLLQWKAPDLQLYRILVYTVGLTFASLPVSDPVGFGPGAVKHQRRMLSDTVGSIEAFVIDQPVRYSKRWPADLGEISISDAPDYLFMALEDASADVVDSGYSFPFVFSGDL